MFPMDRITKLFREGSTMYVYAVTPGHTSQYSYTGAPGLCYWDCSSGYPIVFVQLVT
jgi:hypothetical protein